MEQFNVEWKDITGVKPYARNAKKHNDTQVANVAESIRQFGWQQPIVCDEKGVIIIGHCRLLAAKKLGLEKVPVKTVTGLTDEQTKKLRALDNKLNESEWDFDALLEDIGELDFGDFDIDWGLPKKNEYDDEEYVPEGFDEELMRQYEEHSEEFLAKRRVIITYSPEQENILCDYLGVNQNDGEKLKVIYSFDELLAKKK